MNASTHDTLLDHLQTIQDEVAAQYPASAAAALALREACARFSYAVTEAFEAEWVQKGGTW